MAHGMFHDHGQWVSARGIVNGMNGEAVENGAAGSGPRVAHRPDRKRYELTADGEPAGYTVYVDDGDRRIFYHTEIGERFAGRGLATRLVSAALTDTRDAGRRVVAICPFVTRFLGSHPEFDDVVDPVTPAAMDAVLARGIPPTP